MIIDPILLQRAQREEAKKKLQLSRMDELLAMVSGVHEAEAKTANGLREIEEKLLELRRETAGGES